MILPAGLVLSFYGDDFTGSTDTMEVLAKAGLRTLIFLEPPRPDQLARFPGVRAIGVAGVSRSMPLAEMDCELPKLFASLSELGSPLFHIKICSTFDSAPHVGSIGRTIELGLKAFPSAFVPLIVGAPTLNRFCAFGNLFARSGPESGVFRLDRHPTMSLHPITPMDESDLRLHLARQTELPIELVSLLDLDRGPEWAAARTDELIAGGNRILLFDTVTRQHLAVIGRLLWDRARARPPLFVIGSSGVEYALYAFWRDAGNLPEPAPHIAVPVDQVLVVSGSCSPVTDRQIGHALDNGFVEAALDPIELLDRSLGAEALERATTDIVAVLQRGHSVVAHTCRGPDDARLTAMRTGASSPDAECSGQQIGRVLGRLIREVLHNQPVMRLVIAGGDTSGYAARELGIEALEFVAPLAPGSPLCRIYSPDTRLEGVEIVFKGGQVGAVDLFASIRHGVPTMIGDAR